MDSTKIKNLIEGYMKSTNRKGIKDLLNHMEVSGFYDAPCSSKFHLSKEGGLAQHTVNVLTMALKLNESLEANIPEESIIIAAILHDLGKMGDYGKSNYIENILKSGKQSEAEPYKSNKDLLYVPHEIRSIAIAERFIALTEEEEFAILQHNGMYGELKYSLNGKETPLMMILHWADMWACRVIEKEGE